MASVDPAVVLETIFATGETLGEITGTGSLERRDGYVVNESVMPIPEGNGMYVHGPDERPAIDDMAGLREGFLARGRPFGVSTIDGRTPNVERAAEQLGLVPASHDTAMALPNGSFREADGPQLRIDRVPAADAEAWVEVVSAGFEAPSEIFRSILTRPMLDVFDEPWIGAVIGWLDDVPVSTACFLVRGDGVGIVNVATPPAHRGRGYASAVTSDVVRRGFEAGASFAWLEASPMGLGLYERLGFRPVWSSTCRAVPTDEA